MEIAVLGMGRLGRTLAGLLAERGHTVRAWRRGAPIPPCEVALITVSDASIQQVAALIPPGPVVLHTSGAREWEILRPHRPAGSLHPLQSFPGPDVAIPPLQGVPAAVAGDPEAVQIAREIAGSLGMSPFDVPGDRRLYHAAAVMAGNFATVLLSEAARLLSAAGVDPALAPGILAPLALTSLRQSAPDPARALTGPFARRDAAVIRSHMEALRALAPEITPLYQQLGLRAAALIASNDQVPTEEVDEVIRSLQ